MTKGRGTGRARDSQERGEIRKEKSREEPEVKEGSEERQRDGEDGWPVSTRCFVDPP